MMVVVFENSIPLFSSRCVIPLDMQKFPLKMATKDLLITELYRDRDQHQLDYFESLASVSYRDLIRFNLMFPLAFSSHPLIAAVAPRSLSQSQRHTWL